VSGYFSRLIEQSGIPGGPAAGPASALPARPPARIDLEAQVEPQGEEQIFETREGPETASEVPGRIVEEPTPPVERVLDREAPEFPLRRPEDTRRSETSEGGVPDPRASELTSPRRTTDAGGPPARLDAGEAHNGAEWPVGSIREVLERDQTAATLRADERSPSIDGASGEAPASLPREEPQDRGGRELVWQNAFEEVRGWVAGSPVADEGRAQEDVSRAMASKSVNAGAPFFETTVRPGPASPREEPQTRDLRLEIGTISVTVEPRGEVPGPNQRVETPERKPAGGSERSRLSRHYVRVR
jgi:hypothetical protein